MDLIPLQQPVDRVDGTSDGEAETTTSTTRIHRLCGELRVSCSAAWTCRPNHYARCKCGSGRECP